VFNIFVLRYFWCGVKFLSISIVNIIKWFFIGLITTILIFPYHFCLGIYYLINKERRSSVGFIKPIIPTIMMFLSLATYFISVFIFTRWYVQNERIERMSEDLGDYTVIFEKEEEVVDEDDSADVDSDDEDNYDLDNNVYYYDLSYMDADFDYLLSINTDTVAYLKVNGTNISYPVVQASDNDFYLNHDINKRTTNVGWIFGDYRNNFETLGRNTIIYGHNLINKSMFGSLPWILKANWYNNENNRYIKMATKNQKIIWEVFSVYKIEPVVDYLKTGFGSDSEYYSWLSLMKSRSIHDFGVDLVANDRILTLSTCDDTGNMRVVLHAKMISVEDKY